jgi:hypothetical protein
MSKSFILDDIETMSSSVATRENKKHFKNTITRLTFNFGLFESLINFVNILFHARLSKKTHDQRKYAKDRKLTPS